MQGQRLKASLIASLAIVALAGCGASPSPLARPVSGASPKTVRALSSPATSMRATRTSSAPQAQPDDQDISKNPFVIWIKQTHPQAAASIINQYLSSEGPPNPDPATEGQRVLLRRQVLDTIAKELVKNLNSGLPKGLTARAAEPGRVRVSGHQRQFGFKIELQFDFTIEMDRTGMVWLRPPAELVKAQADSVIVRVLGGDLNKRAYAELVKELDKQGPPQARKTPGLTYRKGGTFRIDPGFAFVNMPA